MLGTAALSELPLSALSAGNPASAPATSVAVCTAVGQASVAIGRPGTVLATATARASARIDRELSRPGFACGSSAVFAVGRIEVGTTVATARTRLLPPLQAHSEALSFLTSALTTVRADRRATSLVLPLVVTATTTVLPTVTGSSRVEELG